MIPVSGIEIQVEGFEPDTHLVLEEPLGGGAFGDVFKARGNSSGKLFAVKFPKVAFGGSTEMAAFENEVRAAQEISHPNVVKVLYAETSSAQVPPFLVMEYVTGGTLKSQLDNYRNSRQLVPLQLFRAWAQELIDGISAINSRMLHRDLKPDNILIEQGSLKIGDFGLSKLVGAATRTNTFKGGQHMYYMAPEGWKFETNDIQIDMYSMGIILFEVASLEYPYDLPRLHFDAAAIRDMHLLQLPKPLKQFRSDLPVGIYHLITRLLEKRPVDRFTNWGKVKEAFEKAWESSPSSESTHAPDPISRLLEQSEQLHHEATAGQLEQERQARELNEQMQLDEYQRGKLMKSLRDLVREFNDHSSLGNIREQPGEIFVLPYGSAPNGNVIHFDFFGVDPPLNLKIGTVRFAAALNDSGYPRLNYLLCRSDESDLYGEWVVCEAKNRAWAKPEKRHLSPFHRFGFRSHEIHHIPLAEQAVHVYEIEFNSDVGTAFLNAVSESMDRPWK
jgi:eukaryotic-like serine/threonine-protein kinase